MVEALRRSPLESSRELLGEPIRISPNAGLFTAELGTREAVPHPDRDNIDLAAPAVCREVVEVNPFTSFYVETRNKEGKVVRFWVGKLTGRREWLSQEFGLEGLGVLEVRKTRRSRHMKLRAGVVILDGPAELPESEPVGVLRRPAVVVELRAEQHLGRTSYFVRAKGGEFDGQTFWIAKNRNGRGLAKLPKLI